MLVIWVQFVAISAIILYFGSKLSKYADVIAKQTGLGHIWVGTILLATVTSLPELFTGISSVAIVGAPNIAVGDVAGSCLFNMLILVLVDYLYGGQPILSRARRGHILSAGFGVLVIGIATYSILWRDVTAELQFLNVALVSPIFLIVYVYAMRSIFSFEQEELSGFVEEVAQEAAEGGTTLRQAYIGYTFSAIFVIFAAVLLPDIAVRISEITGFSRTFVGTLFVAFSTSLPELVVAVVAVRLGAADMAIANILGSNLFNITILFIDDIFYRPGVLLASVSALHASSFVTVLALYGLAIVGLIYRLERKTHFRLGWESVTIAVMFLVNAYLLATLPP